MINRKSFRARNRTISVALDRSAPGVSASQRNGDYPSFGDNTGRGLRTEIVGKLAPPCFRLGRKTPSQVMSRSSSLVKTSGILSQLFLANETAVPEWLDSGAYPRHLECKQTSLRVHKS